MSHIRAPEIRAKQSASMKERVSPLLGKKKSKLHRLHISEAKTGKESPFKGKRHTEESKQNMSAGKIGIRLSVEQRAERKRLKTEIWIKNHPERMRELEIKSLPNKAKKNAERRRALRLQGVHKLGGRCSSPTCKWVNEDGTKGCTDYRILQFDHILGGGTKERKTVSFEKLCKDVISDINNKYQLLCSNCNWIKAFENREFVYKYGGALR